MSEIPRCLLLLAAALSVLVLNGCSSAPEGELSREPVRYVSLPNGHDPLNPDQPLPRYTAALVNVAEGVIPYFERERGHLLQILALSGGGQNRAFGAGFLNAWQERGGRPRFDIVTRVNAGSLGEQSQRPSGEFAVSHLSMRILQQGGMGSASLFLADIA